MKAKRRLVIALGCAAVIVSLILAGVIAALARIPSIGEQLPENSAPILITITNPPNDTEWPLNAYIPVRAITVSREAVSSLEFWADGTLIEAKAPPEGGDRAYISSLWYWPPGVAGDHSLIVRAVDIQGRVAASNVVRLAAIEAVGYRILHTVQPADTLDGLSQKYNTPPETIIQANPTIKPKDSLKPGQSIFIPQPPWTVPAPAVNSPVAPQFPIQAAPGNLPGIGKVSFWIESNLVPPGQPPAAPEVSASVDVCNIRLAVTDKSSNEDGFFVYQSVPPSTSFQRIATLAPHVSGEFEYGIAMTKTGISQYYAASFNKAGEAPSNIVSSSVTSGTCNPSGIGELQYENGVLTLPESMDLAYMYVAKLDGPWMRLPSDPQKFFTATQGKIDIYQELAALMQSYPNAASYENTLLVELWGWVGGTLKFIGKFYIEIRQAHLAACVYEPKDCNHLTYDAKDFQIHIEQPPPSPLPAEKRLMGWNASSMITAKYGLWQVGLFPFTAGFQPKPPGLVASALSDNEEHWPFWNTFPVEFGTLSGAMLPKEALQPKPPSTSMLPFGQDFPSIIPVLNNLEVLGLPIRYYVRVTPMNGNQPAGESSNTMVVTYGEPPAQPPSTLIPNIYDVEVLPETYTRPQQMDWNQWGCVVVEGTNEKKCPASIGEPGFWEELWGLIKGFFKTVIGGFLDAVHDALEAAKSFIVDGVVALLKPLGVNCDDTCQSGLKKGLEIGVTALTGIPSSLPNSEQLENMGIEYAVSEAASYMGADCPSQCREFLRGEMRKIYEAAKQAQSQPGCTDLATLQSLKKQQLCLGNVKTKPAPGSVYVPATIQVRVTRKMWPPGHTGEDRSFGLNVVVKSCNKSLVGKKINITCPNSAGNQGSVSLPGIPYTASNCDDLALIGGAGDPSYSIFEGQHLPLLQPGESIVIPITFEESAGSGNLWSALTAIKNIGSGGVPPCYLQAVSDPPDSSTPIDLGGFNFYGYEAFTLPGSTLTAKAEVLCHDAVNPYYMGTCAQDEKTVTP